ncbi:NYN domain-containing protein [Candidatus Parcubacteria bacterium]|nr:NYN domain-containing protein [Candidatus Parcubacteria bacterium]
MIKRFLKGKVSVFIDASNIYHSYKRLKWKIDLAKYVDYLRKESDLCEIYYYTGRDFDSNKQTKFINFLEKTGYKVRSKKIKFIKNNNTKTKTKDNGFFKGNLDVELVIDVLETKDDYNSLILVSGDSDFEPLLKLMKKKYNKKCLVMATKHSISIELIKCAKFINFNKIKKYIEKV